MAKKKEKAKPEFVPDCSLAVSWFFQDEANAYAESVEDSLAAASAAVPSLWPLEVGNALVIGRTAEACHRSQDDHVPKYSPSQERVRIIVDHAAWARSVSLGKGWPHLAMILVTDFVLHLNG